RATTSRALATGRIGERRAAELLDVLTGEPVVRSEPPTTPGRPAVVHTISELRTLLPAGRRGGPHRRAVVMTMGALHAGHLELVRRARALADEVVVTVFVNPLQFGDARDLDTYPRTLEADVAALTDLGGVDVVFAPSP